MTVQQSRQLQGKTILEVVRSGLCTGCGTCAGICPRNAIEMVLDRKEGVYRADLNTDKCDCCGLCLTSCPGHAVDFDKLKSALFGTTADHDLLGNVVSCYAGYAGDDEIRCRAASGGLVTSLLIFALRQGIIDGAIVTRMDETNPLRPRSFVARTQQEIISAAGSKYCPAPVNTSIKELLQSKGRYAVVGLPCHIHGLRKAEQVINGLREKIVLHFGLVCNHTPSFRATEYLLRKFDKKEIAAIQYRGEGWPGGVSVYYRNGQRDFIEFRSLDYWGFAFQYFFWPHRCLVCGDKICELSDISFMDAWLPQFRGEKAGMSLFVTRSPSAEQLVKQAQNAMAIFARPISAQKVCDSQSLPLVRRKTAARRRLFEALRRRVPEYKCHRVIKVSPWDVLGEGLIFVVGYLGDRSPCLINVLGGAWKLLSQARPIAMRSQFWARTR